MELLSELFLKFFLEFFELFLEFFFEIFWKFFWDFFEISIFVQVGVCGCAGVGKEKFDLMTGGGREKINH